MPFATLGSISPSRACLLEKSAIGTACARPFSLRRCGYANKAQPLNYPDRLSLPSLRSTAQPERPYMGRPQYDAATIPCAHRSEPRCRVCSNEPSGARHDITTRPSRRSLRYPQNMVYRPVSSTTRALRPVAFVRLDDGARVDRDGPRLPIGVDVASAQPLEIAVEYQSHEFAVAIDHR